MSNSAPVTRQDVDALHARLDEVIRRLDMIQGIPRSMTREVDLPREDTIVHEDTASVMLGISHVHLRRLRARGKGPAHIRLSEKRVGYRVSEIERYIAARTVHGHTDT